MLCPISAHAATTPHHPALLIEGKTLSYQELDHYIQAYAAHLMAQGISKRDRIACLGTTNLGTIVLIFALFRIGASVALLNTRLPKEQIETALLELAATRYIQPEIEKLTPVTFSQKEWDLEQVATLLFTSGSSGKPKIACHSLSNYYYSALGSNPHVRLEPHGRWLLSLPLFHVGGLAILFRSFIAGSTLCISRLPLKQSLAAYQITHLSLVPTQLYRLLKENPEPPMHLQCILLGGAPLPLSLCQEAAAKGFPLFPTYGMTEMSSQITSMAFSLGNPAAYLGLPLPYRALKIDALGEIFVKGPTLFQGYWDKEHGLSLPLDAEGWFATGDLGSYDAEKGLIFEGRKDNLFISGGENIQPEEIEKALFTLPGISDAVVVPVKDQEFGARPAAFIQKDALNLSDQALLEQLKKLLPSYKIPIYFFTLPPMEQLKKNRLQLTLLAAQFCLEK